MTRQEFDEISDEVFAEIVRATEKHPEFPEDPVGMTSILSEESGEAAREANRIVYDKEGKLSDLRKELIQSACVSYRAVAVVKKLQKKEER